MPSLIGNRCLFYRCIFMIKNQIRHMIQSRGTHNQGVFVFVWCVAIGHYNKSNEITMSRMKNLLFLLIKRGFLLLSRVAFGPWLHVYFIPNFMHQNGQHMEFSRPWPKEILNHFSLKALGQICITTPSFLHLNNRHLEVIWSTMIARNPKPFLFLIALGQVCTTTLTVETWKSTDYDHSKSQTILISRPLVTCAEQPL